MTRESAVVQEVLQACAYKQIQILEPRFWNRKNPPQFEATDPAIRGVAWRNNTGVARYGENQERRVRFGIPGQPDIVGVIRGGRYFGFECKAASGRPSPYQLWFHKFFGGLGMEIAIVRGYLDAVAVLKQWGIS